MILEITGELVGALVVPPRLFAEEAPVSTESVNVRRPAGEFVVVR